MVLRRDQESFSEEIYWNMNMSFVIKGTITQKAGLVNFAKVLIPSAERNFALYVTYNILLYINILHSNILTL